ncbi:MAG TPA: hypothetical protein VFJ06_05110 [Halococcus sp.]|nr:hypothetical protein [Halococcus sp.]
MLPLQIPGIPAGPEIIILLFFVIPPLIAAYLAYRTGKSAGDQDAILWAAVIAVLTGLGLFPGIIVLAAYSYVRRVK